MSNQNATGVASDTTEAIFRDKAISPISPVSSAVSVKSEAEGAGKGGKINTGAATEPETEPEKIIEAPQTQQDQQAKLISSSPASRVNFVNIPRVLK